MTMRVAAVIPNYNRADLLRTAILDLRRQTRPFDEVIVSDDGSRDDSVKVARQMGAALVTDNRNSGFAAAVNRGVRATTADWVAILNNDATLDPAWLDTALSVTGDRDYVVGKVLSTADHRVIDGTYDLLARSACALRAGAGVNDGPRWNQAREVRFAPMTAALFRRKLFEEVGYLDEWFGSYLEDIDLGLRCALAGKRGFYEPRAVAYHQGSATLGKWSYDTARLIARNQILLARKHFHAQPQWPIVVGQLLWGLVALRHGAFGAYCRGKLEGLSASIPNQEHPPEALAAVLEECEREILNLQREAGFDRYWRAYFWLSRP